MTDSILVHTPEPAGECCKCKAYQEILAAQSVRMAQMKKELQTALQHFGYAHANIQAAEKIAP